MDGEALRNRRSTDRNKILRLFDPAGLLVFILICGFVWLFLLEIDADKAVDERTGMKLAMNAYASESASLKEKLIGIQADLKRANRHDDRACHPAQCAENLRLHTEITNLRTEINKMKHGFNDDRQQTPWPQMFGPAEER